MKNMQLRGLLPCKARGTTFWAAGKLVPQGADSFR